MWTGAILIGVGLVFLIRGWFLTEVGRPPLSHRGAVLDPQIALVGAALLVVVGLVLVELRNQRRSP
jgi:hypothetical protein